MFSGRVLPPKGSSYSLACLDIQNPVAMIIRMFLVMFLFLCKHNFGNVNPLWCASVKIAEEV